MEETLGKRIVAHRKRLGLTQDALAELLGVTAQAVSKWENNQSCPDITMVPKLAEVFDITTDELLGIPKKKPYIAEVVTANEQDPSGEPGGLRMENENGIWELNWDAGRRGSIGFALWLLLAGGLSLAAAVRNWSVDIRHIVWSSGLLVFGLFGLLTKFSGFRLGCFLFGGYFLLWHIHVLPPALTVMQWEVVIPMTLLLFGLCTLIDSLAKPKKGHFHVKHNGKTIGDSSKNYCTYDGEHFACSTCFGEGNHVIQLPRLSGGRGEVSFGELTLDLSGCGEIADSCTIDLDCSFGSLEIQIPRQYRVEAASSTTFGSVDTKGSPLPDASSTVYLSCKANFGEITIRHI